MKYFRIVCVMLLTLVVGAGFLDAQAREAREGSTLKGMSLNGATGLYSIPSGRIGWESARNIGLDLGYHAIINGRGVTHIPSVSMSLFKWVELSAAFDLQPDGYMGHDRGTDFIGGLKIQLPFSKSAIALGGNFQSLNLWDNSYNRYKAGQIYMAVSYSGLLFHMPAETTIVVGKTFGANTAIWDIDFGMGFDLVILPKVFNRYVHWVTDFSNFSYSVEPYGADARDRGVLNTGIRLDLTVIPIFKKFRFVLDVLLTDVFDTNRAFSVGVLFGIPVV